MNSFVEIPVNDPLRSAWLDTSDFGNAKRVVIVAQGKLLWIEDAQAWAWFDGMRYDLERGAMEAQRIAHAVIEHIDREAEELGAIAEDGQALRKKVGEWCTTDIAMKRVETLRGHATKSGSAGATAGMLKQARSFLTARLDDFDQDPLAYNCLNGTLRFVEKDGVWSCKFTTPHDPADMFMQVANVLFDPKATAPFWNERLAMLTPDPEQLTALKPLYGYTLTGLTSDQSFYVHQGKGGDGKSMTHQALGELHGDYFRHAGVKTFLEGREGGGAEHRSDLVRLRGDVRFVVCDEPPKRAVWDGGVIKQITGSLVTARGANERTEITYKPHFKMHCECNVIPRAPSDDKGFRRRFKLYMHRVSLDSTPAGAMPIDLVLKKLADEKSGILNWLIEGALEWLTTRVVPQPSAMMKVLADYWADSSPLLEWMGEWCDTSDPEAMTQASVLYEAFKKWCEDAGREHVMNPTSFGRALRDKQFDVFKDSRGVRHRKGIRLRAEPHYGEAGPSVAAAGPLPPEGDAQAKPAGPTNGDDFVPGFS